MVEQTNVPAQRLKQETAILSRTVVRNLNVKQERMVFLNCIFIKLQNDNREKNSVNYCIGKLFWTADWPFKISS